MPESTVSLEKSKAAEGVADRLRSAVKALATMALWIVLCFGGAGNLAWLRGWVCITAYLLVMTLTGVLMRRFNPGLMQARGKWKANTQSFDKVFLAVYLPLTLVQVFVGGMDAVRFGWMPLPEWTLWPGILLFLAAMGLVNWTLTTNPFAETTVRLQSDRGQRVITTGPYRLVRHPMYLGMIFLNAATALMLGSGWAMAVAGLMAALMVWRTAREDRFLYQSLSGYPEYAARTGSRLLPGLW
jgi:protein-S-isoprenylcysteine O-methyltransferase Ste14